MLGFYSRTAVAPKKTDNSVVPRFKSYYVRHLPSPTRSESTKRAGRPQRDALSTNVGECVSLRVKIAFDNFARAIPTSSVVSKYKLRRNTLV